MTYRLQSRPRYLTQVAAALDQTQLRLSASFMHVPLPAPLEDWLARLRLLKGVPFSYLVPDEAMLPPESIRFFTLDRGWIETLADGALSIGRTLGSQPDLALSSLEAAAQAHAAPRAQSATPRMRARALGREPAPAPSGPITGFLLRSRLVSNTPGMGVSVYPKGHTPADHDADPSVEIKLLDILRYETLGAKSDVLICLIAGDGYRVDIHQPPEQLHYGIDSFEAASGGTVHAEKKLHTFTKSTTTTPQGTSTVKITLNPDTVPVDISAAFRSNGRRVAKMSTLSDTLARANTLEALDAAEMGFEMTQGVGMVSFFKGGSQ
ncbi:hypothetical protein FGG78_07770 [Thioclava sp. BHET1]|nr:hypothetical protein FGG78_07770 [Thioclava sp. BHET1]